MSAYRFCRTDDIELLVDALNRCRAPGDAEPPETAATFKRSIRNVQVWCSSCMVAFAGAEPIGVLIGAKRPSATLVHRIAVHPDHRRRGHARHLLASLSSKLAILGPPRLVAEIPDTLAPACGLFSTSGYIEETILTDYVLHRDAGSPRPAAGRFLIPVTVEDLAANGLLDGADPHVCWTRAVETLAARKDELAGLAIASDERIEAAVLYLVAGAEPDRWAEVVWLRSFVDDAGDRLQLLVAALQRDGVATLRFPKVHSAEVPAAWLEATGFRPAGACRRYAATPRPA